MATATFMLWLNLTVDWGTYSSANGVLGGVTVGGGPMVWTQFTAQPYSYNPTTDSFTFEPLNISYEFVEKEVYLQSKVDAFLTLPPSR